MPRLVVLLVLALLAAPAAQAAWAAKGAHEPDTRRDVEDGFAHLEPDADPERPARYLYFNGFLGTSAGLLTSFNPNLASQETAVMSHPAQPFALLGVWKDCNRDGYVGLGDNGLLEYRAEVLVERDVCPVDHRSPAQWGFLVHNDGSWVHEFHPIGYDNVNAHPGGVSVDENPYNFNDTGARVWADYDLPESPLRPTCAVRPPTGSLRTTGGLLRWADCSTGYQGVAAVSWLASAAGAPGLSFEDAPRDRPDQSGSALNQPNPWGDQDDAAMLRVFDCSAPGQPYEVSDPTGGSLRTVAAVPVGGETHYVNLTDEKGRILHGTLRSPGVFLPDPQGSPAGTVNETEEAIDKCDRSDDARTNSEAPYLVEGTLEPTSDVTGRTRPDFTFAFEEGDRQATGARAALGPGSRGPDADGGTGVATPMGFWAATGASALSRNPFVQRETLAPEGVTHLTYYAHVSTSFVHGWGLKTPGQLGFYGAEACGRSPSPFACDASKWWRDASGRDVVPRDARLGSADGFTPRAIPETEIGVRVLQPYQLRDIDCYDQSARGAREAGAQFGAVTGTACDRPG